MANIPENRQIHLDIQIGRPDGVTWVSIAPWVTRAEIELGNVDALGTGMTGADGVVRRLSFTLMNDGELNPLWDEDLARDEEDVVGDEEDVVGIADAGGETLINLLFNTQNKWNRNSFHPRDQDSEWNQFGGSYSPLLFPMREVTVAIAVTEIGESPITDDWVEVFHGYIGDHIRTTGRGSRIEVDCRDLSKRIQNTYIEREWDAGEEIWVARKYPKSEADEPVEDVLQDILDDNNLPDVIIYTPSGTAVTPFDPTESPFWDVPWDEEEPLAPANASVWDVLQGIVAQFGWFLGYRWHEPTEEFQLVLMEPPRTKGSGDADFELDYRSDFYAQDLDVTDRDIRNAVTINYNDTDGNRRSLTMVDDDSIDTYGRRAMEIELADTDLIRTEAGVTTLAEAALHDLSSQSATTKIDMPVLPLMDIFAGINVVNDLVSSSTDFFGVESVRHSLQFDGQARLRTEVVASGQVTGGHRKWLRMETRPGSKTPTDPGTPLHVIGLALEERGEVLKDGTYVPIIHASWSNPSDKLFARALVYYRRLYEGYSPGEWRYATSTDDEEHDILLVATGDYEVKVVSESTTGEHSEFDNSPTESITVVGKEIFDGIVIWGDIIWDATAIHLNWDEIPDPDLVEYAVRTDPYFG